MNHNMNNPKVTVLLSIYNGERYVKEAIDSILNQTYNNFEFLIIDDASTDNTPEILQSYNDPRIKVIRNSENLGLTKSLNIGLGLARGEYIARIDADDISMPERFTEEVNYLDSNSDVAVVGTGRENIDDNGKVIETVIPPKIVSFEHLLKGNQFQHSSVMFRKEIVVKEGGYCPLMHCCQDYYLWLKLARNHSLHNIPDVLSKLRIQKNSVSFTKVHESALSQIFAIRILNNSMKESDICYDTNSVNFSKDEQIYYLTRLAECHKINENFNDARKIYMKIFLIDNSMSSIVNYFRMFFGRWFISETTKIHAVFRDKLRINK